MFQRDLEEIPTETLTNELCRRDVYADMGQCHYCGHPLDTHTCKFAPNQNLPGGRDGHLDSPSPAPEAPRMTHEEALQQLAKAAKNRECIVPGTVAAWYQSAYTDRQVPTPVARSLIESHERLRSLYHRAEETADGLRAEALQSARLLALWKSHGGWSQKVFGADSWKGPVGTLRRAAGGRHAPRR